MTDSERGYFYGTYTAMNVPAKNVFISGNKFWYSTGVSPILGYRGYFEFHDVLQAYYDSGAEVKINFLLDDATGIKRINNGQLSQDNVIYNLSGQRVSKAQGGIYIVNGKKQAVK